MTVRLWKQLCQCCSGEFPLVPELQNERVASNNTHHARTKAAADLHPPHVIRHESITMIWPSCFSRCQWGRAGTQSYLYMIHWLLNFSLSVAVTDRLMQAQRVFGLDKFLHPRTSGSSYHEMGRTKSFPVWSLRYLGPSNHGVMPALWRDHCDNLVPVWCLRC